MRSFRQTGIPCKGPLYLPCFISNSALSASCLADFSKTVMKALSSGFNCEILSSVASIRSKGEISPEEIAVERSLIVKFTILSEDLFIWKTPLIVNRKAHLSLGSSYNPQLRNYHSLLY